MACSQPIALNDIFLSVLSFRLQLSNIIRTIPTASVGSSSSTTSSCSVVPVVGIARVCTALDLLSCLCLHCDTHDTIIQQLESQPQPWLMFIAQTIMPKSVQADQLDVHQSADRCVIHPKILEGACGPVDRVSIRDALLGCVRGLCGSRGGREAMRYIGMYEVVRQWHLLETEESLLSGIEDIVHLLHYSENELDEQDKQTSTTVATNSNSEMCE
eukprot:GHVS01055600.1.p1 GENE.GHVS01055600.1~~GHVS01055600.1.p1  ORF type:complete len:245 (+),score=38.53 GHVS01055600.1:91-735(+)